MKSIKLLIGILFVGMITMAMSCGVYTLTGASITGKTLNIHTLENHAPNVAPSLSTTLTDKLRNRILSQTGLAPVNTDVADYDMKGVITGYNVTNTGVQNTAAGIPQSAKSRLNVTVEVTFLNRLDDKMSFKQAFTRFYDYDANLQLQAIESAAIDEISNQIADDIFNKAFVNW